MAKKPETIDHLDLAIARWETRLKVAMTKLSKLKLKRKRLAAKGALNKALDMDVNAELAKLTIRPKEDAAVVAAREAFAESERVLQQPVAPKEDGLDIPTFLARPKVTPEAQQILDEQAAAKTAKSRGRIATMKAKQAGDTKRMPLTGKAALAALEVNLIAPG